MCAIRHGAELGLGLCPARTMVDVIFAPAAGCSIHLYVRRAHVCVCVCVCPGSGFAAAHRRHHRSCVLHAARNTDALCVKCAFISFYTDSRCGLGKETHTFGVTMSMFSMAKEVSWNVVTLVT